MERALSPRPTALSPRPTALSPRPTALNPRPTAGEGYGSHWIPGERHFCLTSLISTCDTRYPKPALNQILPAEQVSLSHPVDEIYPEWLERLAVNAKVATVL
jgi:hypothetical protein